MPFWPFLPVWPFLIVAALVGAIWNPRAALAFIGYVLAVRAAFYFSDDPSQLVFMAIYTACAVTAFFFIDQTAGVALALIGIVQAAHLIGVLPWIANVSIGELVFALGVFASAYNGPNGGTFIRNPRVLNGGHHNPVSGGASGSKITSQDGQVACQTDISL